MSVATNRVIRRKEIAIAILGTGGTLVSLVALWLGSSALLTVGFVAIVASSLCVPDPMGALVIKIGIGAAGCAAIAVTNSFSAGVLTIMPAFTITNALASIVLSETLVLFVSHVGLTIEALDRQLPLTEQEGATKERDVARSLAR